MAGGGGTGAMEWLLWLRRPPPFPHGVPPGGPRWQLLRILKYRLGVMSEERHAAHARGRGHAGQHSLDDNSTGWPKGKGFWVGGGGWFKFEPAPPGERGSGRVNH